MKNKKWNNLKNINLELENKTIGIVGLGNVGLKVAKLAKSFNMKVFYNDIKKNNYAFVKKTKNYIFKNCDIISIHTDLNNKTKELINRKTLSIMKEKAILINTSRGAIVNEKDLFIHLLKKKNFRVGLDVFNNEPKIDFNLVKLKNVLATPHCGPSKETRVKLINTIEKNIKAFEKNKINQICKL